MSVDDIRKLVGVGKEEGYSAGSEMNNSIPPGVQSALDLDDLVAAIRTHGLDVFEGEPQFPYSGLEQRLASESDEIDVNSAPGAPEAANDPVRVYLREMGTSPLLTREGEVEIAKRIERGQLSSLKALSRSPIVIHHVLAIGEELKRGLRSIKEIVVFDEEEITEEIMAGPCQGDPAPHRSTAQQLQNSPPSGRTAGDCPCRQEGTQIPPLPIPAEPRDCPDFAHHPRPRLHPLGAQAPDGTGEYNHGAYVFA